MKTTRLAFFVLLLSAWPAWLHAAAAAAERTTVRAIMIVASNQKGAADPKLAAYEANLKRILRFESFRSVAEGSASVAAGATATVKLARTHRVELASDGKSIRATWFDGDRKVITLTLPPDKPSVLGGPPWSDQGEVCAIILLPN